MDKMTLQSFKTWRIFKGVNELQHEQYNLKQSEIRFIESITMGDIYKDFLTSPFQVTFKDQIDSLLKHTDKEDILGLVSSANDTALCDLDYTFLKKYVEHEFKSYGARQNRYSLMMFQYDMVERLHIISNATSRIKSSSDLVLDFVKEFNKKTDPITLSPNSKEEQSKPVYFINIGKKKTSIITS